MSDAILHVTGARPNFPKAAPVLHALKLAGVEQKLVHTGQHYDAQMSRVFFDELDLPHPDVNLNVGSSSHAVQTAAIMVRLEELFVASRPPLIVVYGDINSTLAAVLVASKLSIPIAHVEAGLRSFDRAMPEEINRLVTDRLSHLLFTTSADAVGHLASEGVPVGNIHFVGNPMIDTLLKHMDRFDVASARSTYNLVGPYVVATLHRPSNVDDPADVKNLVSILHEVADDVPTVLPLHPRGRERLVSAGLLAHKNIQVIEPLGYIAFMSLLRGASAVITDSGGVQEETTVLRVSCLTLRSNTERPVTITHGTNHLVTRDTLVDMLHASLAGDSAKDQDDLPPLWDGKAGQRISDIVCRFLKET